MGYSEQQRIGAAGERRFDDLASRGGFRSLTPSPDILGIDRLIEIPDVASDRTPSSLDVTHPGPIGYVQVKTTARSGVPSFRVGLETCRRFVHADVPVFLALIRIDQHEAIQELFIRHVDEVFGGAVLKQLRALDEGRGTNIVDEKFTVTWDEGHRVEPEGPVLRSRLLDLIGVAASYAKRKAKWRETVGYTDAAWQMGISADPRDVIRHLLGEDGGQFDGEVTDATETRFEIQKAQSHMVGQVKFTLGQSKGIPLTVRVHGKADTVDLPGLSWTPLTFFVSTPLPAGTTLWKFQSGLVSIRKVQPPAENNEPAAVPEKQETMTLAVSCEPERSARLCDWRSSAKAVQLIAAGDVVLSMMIKGVPHSLATFNGPGPGALLDGPIAAVQITAEFAEMAGIDETSAVSGAQLLDGIDERLQCLNFKAGNQVRLGFEIVRRPTNMPTEPVPAVSPMWGRIGSTIAANTFRTEPAVVEVEERDSRTFLHYRSKISTVGTWVLTTDPATAISALRERLNVNDALVSTIWEGQFSVFARLEPPEGDVESVDAGSCP